MDAGWRADPERAGTERWFDGVDWTEHRRIIVSDEGRRLPKRDLIARHPEEGTRWNEVLVGSPVIVGSLYWAVSMFSVPLLARMHPHERPWVKIGFLLVCAIVLAVVAMLDARVLRARGFASVPSGLWALGTPILYLRRRARYVEGADRIPLVIHLALLAMSCFGILLGISVGIGHLAI